MVRPCSASEAFLTTADSAIGLIPKSTKPIPGWNGIEYKAAFPMQKPADASFYPPDMDKMAYVTQDDKEKSELVLLTRRRCRRRKPKDSQWKCPIDHLFYDAFVIWGLVGPRRIFGELGVYPAINWFFLVGAIFSLLAWTVHKCSLGQTWIRSIHFPVFLAMMPPASAVNYTSWIFVAYLSGYDAFRYYQKVWQRYNYVLSGGLNAGTAFMSIFIFFCSWDCKRRGFQSELVGKGRG
ncbi:hypothetical protein L2E82_44956 [Cichorium intybus]|uniref:Uncharacterized protein n=1 Tax=Cichorium intybus TaxID=13427 RepID=A0ACB8ZW25_CICIN|nr:hypothetical protein L2E82_44956 [Cichorium intybus]